MNKKKVNFIVMWLIMLSVFSGCSSTKVNKEQGATSSTVATTHIHDFMPANCKKPQTCSCGETAGEPLGHHFESATCTSSEKCTRCPAINGKPLGHDYSDATYDAPKTCKNCGKTVGTKIKLSDSYVVLASGQDADGTVYELVASEVETYAGVAVTVGVIKNNQWLVEMTSEMPLIDEDDTLYGTGVSGLDSAPETIFYIGNGCFIYRNVESPEYGSDTYQELVYNSENGKYYELTDGGKMGSKQSSHVIYKEYSLDREKLDLCKPHHIYVTDMLYCAVASDEELVLWQYSAHWQDGDEVVFLNTTNMRTHKVKLQKNIAETKLIYPLSEGFFAVYTFRNDLMFFDTSGKMVLDLSMYELTHEEQPLLFVNGKCSFTIFNNAGTIYKITVDKQGQVLDSSKL